MPQTVHNAGADKLWATPGLIDWLLAQHRPPKPPQR
jgi:hypothetical protein